MPTSSAGPTRSRPTRPCPSRSSSSAAAGLERAVAFTNAVLRRLSEGIARLLVESLPEGPLQHSYPDWIAEVWERDLGRDDALALMRAQNEPPETVVRVFRGELSR